MKSRKRCFAAVIAGAIIFVAGHATVRGQEKSPADTTGTANPAVAKVAVPSQAAPFKWSDQPDARPPHTIPQAEQEKLGLEFLRAFHPLRARQIEHEEGMHPQEYYDTLRDAFHQRWQLERARIEEPGAFARREETLQLNARLEQLALHYREATPDQQPAIEAQLKTLTAQAFEKRQAEMEAELKELERQYQRVKTMVEKRRKYKDRVIEMQVFRLLGEEEIFELW